MAELTWEKPQASAVASRGSQRIQFMIGGALLMAVVAYLIVISTASGARYFITVDELVGNPEYVNQTVRISGAVVGETIAYDAGNLIIDFTIANIPAETTDLALTLHQAATNPNTTRVKVHIENQVKPDLLQHEAQAILTGKLGKDGTFYASELLLKCPSRYEETVPDQVGQAPALETGS